MLRWLTLSPPQPEMGPGLAKVEFIPSGGWWLPEKAYI